MDKLISSGSKVLNRLLSISVVCLCVAFFAAFLYVVLNRLFFPYDLEWIEGGVADHVYRVVHGLPLYCEPTLEYTPFVYTPLYYYLSALLSLVTGMGFVPLRLLSITCTMISFYIAGRFVYNETHSWFSTVVTIGLFAASYSMTACWFDVGRVDNLMLMFLLGAVYFIRYHETYKGIIVSGVLFVLAFLSKQQITFAFASMLVFLVIQDWKKSLVLLVTFVTSLIVIVLLLDAIYDGWFSFYVFTLSVNVFGDTLNLNKLQEFIKVDIASNTAYALIVICSAALVTRFGDKRKLLFYIFFVIGMILGVIPNRIINGGAVNSAVPAFIAISILTGISVFVLSKYAKSKHSYPEIICLATNIILLLVFVSGVYDPRKVIPVVTGQDNRSKIVELMKTTDGEVFCPSYGYLPTKAGKTMSASLSSFYDIITSADSYQKQKMTDAFLYRLKTHYYSLIILDQYSFNLMKRDWVDVSEYYSLSPVTEDLKISNFPIRTIHDDTLVFIPNDSNTQ